MKHLWGQSEVVYEDSDVARGVIVVRASAFGQYAASSVHHHKQHRNMLLVLSGSMILRTFTAEGEQVDVMDITAGMQVMINPGGNHQIEFPEPCELMEWYIAEPDQIATLDDIFRIEPGKEPIG